MSGKTLLRALKASGWAEVRVRGSHHYLVQGGSGYLVAVPVHGNRDLPTGTLRAILRQTELTADELAELLQ